MHTRRMLRLGWRGIEVGELLWSVGATTAVTTISLAFIDDLRALHWGWQIAFIAGVFDLFIFAIWFFWPMFKRLRTGTPEETPSEMLNDSEREHIIRDWLDGYSMSVQRKQGDNPFELVVTKREGQTVWVTRTRDEPEFLHVCGFEGASEELYRAIDGAIANLEVRIEMLRLRVEYDMLDFPTKPVHFWTKVPFDHTLTKSRFLEAYHKAVRGRILVRTVIERLYYDATQSSPETLVDPHASIPEAHP